MRCQSPEDFSSRTVLCMVGIYSSLFAGRCVVLIANSSSVLGFSWVYFLYLILRFACILLSGSPLFGFSLLFYFSNCSYLNNVSLYFYSSNKMFIAICVYTYPALSVCLPLPPPIHLAHHPPRPSNPHVSSSFHTSSPPTHKGGFLCGFFYTTPTPTLVPQLGICPHPMHESYLYVQPNYMACWKAGW